jgi:hypothetical protein
VSTVVHAHKRCPFPQPVLASAPGTTCAIDTRAELRPPDPVLDGSVDRCLFRREARRQAQIAGSSGARPKDDVHDGRPRPTHPERMP